jgi:hypothetical protein
MQKKPLIIYPSVGLYCINGLIKGDQMELVEKISEEYITDENIDCVVSLIISVAERYISKRKKQLLIEQSKLLPKKNICIN